MRSRSIDSPETPEEQEARIDAMLKTMIVETAIYATENGEDIPLYTRDQIADFCGCSKDTIRRIEEKALARLREVMG